MNHPGTSGGQPPDATPASGRLLLGRFRVERILGRGGMGEVLLARDELLNRHVALKRLRSEGDDPAERRRVILREARRVGQINDPRIAAIYDVLDLDDDVLLVMEYVDGITLRQRMAEPIPIEAFWRLAPPCVDALAAAHAQGVIHRDIKPENLMLTRDGQVKILDFGIARRSESSTGTTTTNTETRSGVVAGTPYYMAPEAFIGASVDERADVFSMGVVFYELLTGGRPFEGASFAAVLEQMLRTVPTPTRDMNPAVGPALSRLVADTLARDRSDRIESASELRRRLEQAHLEDANALPAPALRSRPDAAAPRARALPMWGYAGIAGTVLVASVVGVWIRSLPTLPSDRNLAVLAPATPGADADFASFALGATDWLSAQLHRRVDTPGFQMASLADGLEEKVASAPDARKVLGSTQALRSTWIQRPDLLRAELELRDTARDRVVASRTVQALASEPFAFLEQTRRAATDMLRLTKDPPGAPSGFGIRGAGTLRFYLQGRGRMRAAETEADMRKAIADFETACRMEPEAPAARGGLAAAQHGAHLLAGDADLLSRAEASARQAVALDSLRPESHRTLGTILATQRNTQGSLDAFARATRLNPADDDSYFRMARAYARLGQPEREKEIYQDVIRRRPHGRQAHWRLATWYFRRGEVDSAVGAYEEMIRRSPEWEVGYASLGGVLVLRGEYPRAVETLKHAVSLRPTRVAYDNLGTAYFNSGRFAEAVDAYNQSFQFGLADYQSWLNLGDAYFWLNGRKADAAKAYEQSVRMGRDEAAVRARQGRSFDAMIPANLATVFPKLGQSDSARVYLGRALAADSANPMVQYCAALTLWQLDEHDRGMGWLRRSVAGGYPTTWLRDSPIFGEWRADSGFRTLIGTGGSETHRAKEGNKGG